MSFRFVYQTEDPVEVKLIAALVVRELNSRGVVWPHVAAFCIDAADGIIPPTMERLGQARCEAIVRLWAKAALTAAEEMRE